MKQADLRILNMRDLHHSMIMIVLHTMTDTPYIHSRSRASDNDGLAIQGMADDGDGVRSFRAFRFFHISNHETRMKIKQRKSFWIAYAIFCVAMALLSQSDDA